MSMFSEVFPPKSKFDTDRDIPDLTGKVVIVTGMGSLTHPTEGRNLTQELSGGNTGIGKQTIKVCRFSFYGDLIYDDNSDARCF